MHVIDNTSRGADGVKTGDLNGDGLFDVVTAWEEGGRVRVYLNPGRDKVKQPWPIVEIGQVPDPEDALLFDVDGDGHAEVLVATERENKRLYEFRQKDLGRPILDRPWSKEVLPFEVSRSFLSDTFCGWALRWLRMIGQEEDCYLMPRPRRWLYLAPLVLNGKPALFAGSKEHHATVSLYQPITEAPGKMKWRGDSLTRAGWIMSLRIIDVDGDGDPDVLYSDRRGSDLDGNGRLDDGITPNESTKPIRGIFWLENVNGQWIKHIIHRSKSDVMFLDVGDYDNDGDDDIVAAIKANAVLVLERRKGANFTAHEIPLPGKDFDPKAAALGDLTGDGVKEIVLTVESAAAGAPRVFYLTRNSVASADWKLVDIGGPLGQKFDRIELRDVDRDGDLDVLTTEEKDNLGVIWYENPLQ